MYNNGDLGNVNVYMCMDWLMILCVSLYAYSYTV